VNSQDPAKLEEEGSTATLDAEAQAQKEIEEAAAELQRRMDAWMSDIVDDRWEMILAAHCTSASYHRRRSMVPDYHPRGAARSWSNGARIERFRTSYLQGTGITHHGIAARAPWGTEEGPVATSNEDAFCLMPKHGVFVVADGVGGSAAGAYASHVVVDAITRRSGALIDGVVAANSFLSQHRFSAQSTVAGAEITPDGELYPFWVGDSRILVLDERGNLCFRSHDHGIREIRDNIEMQEVLDLPDRNIVTQSVGYAYAPLRTSLDTNPEDFFVQLRPGYTVLLLTDGILDSMNSYDVAAFLQDHSYVPVDRRAEFLAIEIHERMMRAQFPEYGALGGTVAKKIDNFTVVMVRYGG